MPCATDCFSLHGRGLLDMSDSNPLMADVFRPYEKLVEITILGKTFLVPERNSLLRAFQFISPETVPYGRFCWNQECQYCKVNCQLADDDQARPILSCKFFGFRRHEYHRDGAGTDGLPAHETGAGCRGPTAQATRRAHLDRAVAPNGPSHTSGPKRINSGNSRRHPERLILPAYARPAVRFRSEFF